MKFTDLFVVTFYNKVMDRTEADEEVGAVDEKEADVQAERLNASETKRGIYTTMTLNEYIYLRQSEARDEAKSEAARHYADLRNQ